MHFDSREWQVSDFEQTGIRKPGTGNRKPELGNREPETGNRKPEMPTWNDKDNDGKIDFMGWP